MLGVRRGLPTGSTLTRPAGFDGLCGFRFTLRYLEIFRFLTAKRALMETPALPKGGLTHAESLAVLTFLAIAGNASYSSLPLEGGGPRKRWWE